MENECEALPGVAYPGVRDNRSTINTKTGYDDDDAAAHKEGAISVAFVHPSVCLSIVYIANDLRTQRPRALKF